MTYKDFTKQVSKELNIPIEVVDAAYLAFWKFVKQKIKSLPLKENLTIEEFESLRTNFNIPELGKLYCTYNDYWRSKYRYKEFLKYKKKLEEEK